jgi:hypothetical protein
MFPKLKEKKLPNRAKTQLDVLEIKVPNKKESYHGAYLSKIKEERAEREIIIDSLSDDKS